MSRLLCLVVPGATLAVAVAAQTSSDLRREDALAVIELQPRVDEAIDRGCQRLLDLQQRDGSWFAHSGTFAGGQTALSVYTLLKAGLPRTHPGVQRGLAHLEGLRPDKVYVAGAMLMAFAESSDPSFRAPMERLVQDLLRWQRGSWPYPLGPRDRGLHGDQDLSITQFALLGLRAAARTGLKVPPSSWQDALRTVLRYQDRPRTVGSGKEKLELAGFHYGLGGGQATGSMTTAGLTSLYVAREQLGRVPGDLAREVDDAVRLGRNWLAHHFDARDNPEFAGQRWLYYLYGIERVSALYQVAYWGDHPWYLEGARVLLEKQDAAGAWPLPDPESDTCFAILFLKRATAAKTGQRRDAMRALVGDAADKDVAMKALGDHAGGPWTFLLTRVAATDGTRGYAVDGVQYLVDGAPTATLAGSGKPWTPTEDLAVRWQPARRGSYLVMAQVQAHRLGADGKPLGDAVTLATPPVKVEVAEALEPWMLHAATWKTRNVLAADEVEASASSEFGPDRSADRAVDGREGSAWVCATDDPAPRLVLNFKKPVVARTLVLTQANGARASIGVFDRARRVQVFVNGSKAPLTVEMVADELVPARLELVKTTRVRRLDLAVDTRDTGKTHPGAVGFAEIALER
ncbi:MAG: hypothetical protein R3F56_00180 [Planctomycetota bacterium]